ncbi:MULTISPECIES: aldo/keto reductase [unclassified Shimia]|uniref:aldo/keto reductase n=1 Tax=unclassified Shimia TaxID=2630038 RepID=UPI003107C6E2
MKMNPLGRTGLNVSEYCLGTMTFGTQTNEADAHTQMDMALEHGINFIDAAELYPVNPMSPETQGRTEEILGTWFAKTGRRKDWILATKHGGTGVKYIRDGADISSQTVSGAVEGSLKRLQTDHIDLYQLHWPNRGSYMFRQNWTFDPSSQNKAETLADLEDVLEALQKEIDRGTIGAIGLSNESAWGTSQWLRLSEDKGLPRMASIQNEYSLMCRLFDTDLAELSHNEDVGLLAFSPLAAGLLTGKYQNDQTPKGSRKDINGNLGGRIAGNHVFDAVQAYLDIAAKHGIDPVHMAMAFTVQRPFMCSSIFGATTVDQLDHLLKGIDVSLSKEIQTDIDAAHRAFPMPY